MMKSLKETNDTLDTLRYVADVIRDKLNIVFTSYGYLSSSIGIKTRTMLNSEQFDKICEIIRECEYVVTRWKLEKVFNYGMPTVYFVIHIKGKE